MRERTLKIVNRELEAIERQLKDVDRVINSIDHGNDSGNAPSLGWIKERLETLRSVTRSGVERISDSLDDQTNLTIREYIIRERMKGKTQKAIAARLGLYSNEVSTILKGETPLSQYTPVALKKFR